MATQACQQTATSGQMVKRIVVLTVLGAPSVFGFIGPFNGISKVTFAVIPAVVVLIVAWVFGNSLSTALGTKPYSAKLIGLPDLLGVGLAMQLFGLPGERMAISWYLVPLICFWGYRTQAVQFISADGVSDPQVTADKVCHEV